MAKISRREFVRVAGTAAAALSSGPTAAWPRILGLGAAPATAAAGGALFKNIPASASGITWRHVNGRSSEYYLPETTGAGCAFLDYDNDGWMDIYLVNKI